MKAAKIIGLGALLAVPGLSGASVCESGSIGVGPYISAAPLMDSSGSTRQRFKGGSLTAKCAFNDGFALSVGSFMAENNSSNSSLHGIDVAVLTGHNLASEGFTSQMGASLIYSWNNPDSGSNLSYPTVALVSGLGYNWKNIGLMFSVDIPVYMERKYLRRVEADYARLHYPLAGRATVSFRF
ncbi:hypothetical protein CAI21_19625 [Alkalilimnicola ehrlichii]|uniref:Outer membrane protein beta-barrel domain-containing protein n=1 Tax=Alkalilimnicola ehrlichii TaxID=351052 RepID=A0A3E0WJD9_9GAMM|nr:hypothetical protein [Alkalilimnicola ehrlichii]RFA25182.1 hypothetical protein CAI21_19625 [Alkalilimnicola ehrlichii]RFA32261.1 hypothetical protein CAL65_20045 [Alkalilimnicola ehrlichii]